MNVIALLMLAADPTAEPLPDVVLLDFTASYCQPCQQMVPILQRMERDRYPIRKIDITEHPDLSRKYGVSRIPTLILLVEGKEEKRFVGLTADEELRTAMNSAARRLDKERKPAARQTTESTEQDASFDEFARQQQHNSTPPAPERPSGIRGLLDKVKHGITGRQPAVTRADAETPNFRAQSPDEPNAEPHNDDSLAMQSSVRVRLADGQFHDVGTGTIVHSTKGQSTILTCAHMFKEVSPDAKVQVEVFRGSEVLKYPAEIIGGNHDSDLAFLRIRNREPLPMSPLSPEETPGQPGDPVFSIGCNAGNLPTVLQMKILKINFFEGPDNVVCSKDPVQGRSGGGLFNAKGQLIGVCSGAFRKTNEGLYTGVGAVRQLIKNLELSDLFINKESPRFAVADADPQSTPPENPFHADDDYFEQMFADTAAQQQEAAPENPPSALTPSALTPSAPDPDFTPGTSPPLDDPFAEKQYTPAKSASADAVAEITVIIDDPDSGKRVIVIPRPSPFLMELLTGDASPSNSAVTAHDASPVSATSIRQRSQRTPPAVPGTNSPRSASPLHQRF